MENKKKFELGDEALDAVAGGTGTLGEIYNGWLVDTGVPCDETPGCTSTCVRCFSYGPSHPEATKVTYRTICCGCWAFRFGPGLGSDYIGRKGSPG